MPAGKTAKLYRNTATNASPTWVEVPEIRDLDLPMQADQVDDSDRCSNFKKYSQCLVDLGISGNMTYRNGNANCEAIRDALLAGTVIEWAAMDGDITASGTTGIRFFGLVFSADRGQPLTDSMTVALEIKPTYHEESATVIEPSEYTIT
jgi:hypothetical protein